eukprot:4252340-Amphidinium_carterae.1
MDADPTRQTSDAERTTLGCPVEPDSPVRDLGASLLALSRLRQGTRNRLQQLAIGFSQAASHPHTPVPISDARISTDSAVQETALCPMTPAGTKSFHTAAAKTKYQEAEVRQNSGSMRSTSQTQPDL